MNTNDFERLAPRYLEGTLSERQVAVVTREMQQSAAARERLELLERESGWLKGAFERPLGEPAPDLSRVLLRVRRRNPYRKVIIHPALALALQVLFGLGLVVALFSLNADLIPPELSISDIDGSLSSPNANEDGELELLVGVPVTTPQGSQAKISFAGIDDVMLSEDTRLSVKPPMNGVREVIEIDHGEVWTNLRRREEPLLLQFAQENLSRWQIRADNAQVSVIAGKNSQILMPRGSAPSESMGVVRLLSGSAWIEDRDGEEGPFELSRGVAYSISENAPLALEDPDAAIFSRLRLSKGERFKIDWNWANPEVFPLSVDGVTYPVWKQANQLAETLIAERESARERFGSEEIKSYNQALESALAEIVDTPLPLKTLEGINETIAPEKLLALHLHKEDGGAPSILRAIRTHIAEARSALRASNPKDIDDLLSYLVAKRAEVQQMENLGAAEFNRLKVLLDELPNVEDRSDDAFLKLEAHRKNATLDRDGSKRKGLRETYATHENEAIRLQVFAKDLEAANSSIRALLEEMDEVNLKREPLLEGIEVANADIAKFRKVIDESEYSAEAMMRANALVKSTQTKLDLEQANLAAIDSGISTNETAIKGLLPRVEALRTETASLIFELESLESAVVTLAKAQLRTSNELLSAKQALSELELQAALADDQELIKILRKHKNASKAVDQLEERLREHKAEIAKALDESSGKNKEHRASAEKLHELDQSLAKFENELEAAQAERDAKAKEIDSELKPQLASAKAAAESLVEARRTYQRAERLVAQHKEALTLLQEEIAPLNESIAALEKRKVPLDAEVERLKEVVKPLKGHLSAMGSAENAIRAIERAIDADVRHHINAIHAGRVEINTLWVILDQAAIARSVFHNDAMPSYRKFGERRDALLADIDSIDQVDAEIAALRSDEEKERSALNERLRVALPAAQDAYEALAQDLIDEIDRVRGKDQESLETALLNARAERIAHAWLEAHAAVSQARVHALADKRIESYREFVADKLTFSDGGAFDALEAFASFEPKHRVLAGILSEESRLSASKPAKGQSRLDHEQSKVEERAKLREKAQEFRSESPSAYAREINAMVLYHGELKENREKLFKSMWEVYLNTYAYMPSELRTFDPSARDSKLAALEEDYFHAFKAGDISGEGVNVKVTWKNLIQSYLPRKKLAQLNWLTLQD